MKFKELSVIIAGSLLIMGSGCRKKTAEIVVPDNYNDALAMAASLERPLFVDFFSPT